MKKLFKKLAGLMMGLLVVAGLAGVGANNDAPVKADAASIPASTKFYLTPNSNWKQSNARYAIYFFGNGNGFRLLTLYPVDPAAIYRQHAAKSIT